MVDLDRPQQPSSPRVVGTRIVFARAPNTLLDKITRHEAAGDQLDEEILTFLNLQLPVIHYRNKDDQTFRISHVTMNGRTFQFNLCNESSEQPVSVPTRNIASSDAFSTLGKVLDSICDRIDLYDGIDPNREYVLTPISVEGGYDLASDE